MNSANKTMTQSDEKKNTPKHFDKTSKGEEPIHSSEIIEIAMGLLSPAI